MAMPGSQGSRKSPPTACLVHNGWRLLADEMALVSLQDGGLTALARPISLKNRSIDLIADILPNAALRARSEDTVKGAVALLKPPTPSVERVAEPARPARGIRSDEHRGGTGSVGTWSSMGATYQ